MDSIPQSLGARVVSYVPTKQMNSKRPEITINSRVKLNTSKISMSRADSPMPFQNRKIIPALQKTKYVLNVSTFYTFIIKKINTLRNKYQYISIELQIYCNLR